MELKPRCSVILTQSPSPSPSPSPPSSRSPSPSLSPPIIDVEDKGKEKEKEKMWLRLDKASCFPSVTENREAFIKLTISRNILGDESAENQLKSLADDARREYDLGEHCDAEKPKPGYEKFKFPPIVVGKDYDVIKLLSTFEDTLIPINRYANPSSVMNLDVGRGRAISRVLRFQSQGQGQGQGQDQDQDQVRKYMDKGQERLDVANVEKLKNKYVMVLCVFVPCLWLSMDARLIMYTAAASLELKARNNFEMVVVAMMRDGYSSAPHAFENFMSAFSCLAVPFNQPNRRHYICSALGFVGHPVALLVSPDNKVLHYGQCSLFTWFGGVERDYFPFTPEKAHECFESSFEDCSLGELLDLCDTDVLYSIKSQCSSIPISELKHKFVGLYLCSSGSELTRFKDVYENCRSNDFELEIVVVCFPFLEGFPPMLLQDSVIEALRSLELDWWVLPFNNTVSLRLWRMCELDIEERLLIVDPSGNVDPYGMQLMNDFGIKGYPFTRNKLVDNEWSRIKDMRLESLLLPPESDPAYSVVMDNVEKLRGKRVLLYFCFPEFLSDSDKLKSWCSSHPDYELVFVNLDDSMDDTCLYQMGGWVYPVSNSAKVIDAYYSTHRIRDDKLVAFGIDGRIRLVSAFKLLCDEVQFPDDLVKESILEEFKDEGYQYMRRMSLS